MLCLALISIDVLVELGGCCRGYGGILGCLLGSGGGGLSGSMIGDRGDMGVGGLWKGDGW